VDVCLLSRIQFAVTIGFHFLFPPITIGLAWVLVAIEYMGWRRRDEAWRRAGRLLGGLLGLTFAVGVATGIVMEFQFGTNWARYSKFVGDIFGAPLAAEGIFAFFLESTFLGVYLFARGRISPRLHWLSILMVAVGATLSAFWIIVANSWMQTPAGYTVNAAAGRAELTDFWAAVFNPSTMIRYAHTLTAALVSGAYFAAGAAAYVLLRATRGGAAPSETHPAQASARRTLAVSLAFALVSSILVVVPFGHEHAKQVARTQPEKFAAIEGLYSSQRAAPLVVFALPYEKPPELKARVEVPGMLSWMAFGDTEAPIRGIDDFPAGDVPPLWITFVSFHNMVLLGGYFILLAMYAVWRLRRGTLWTGRWLLWLLVATVPLPLAACQFGWVTAEVGRQPWIVYHVMRTAEAFSTNVPVEHIWVSFILFTTLYAALLVLYLYLVFHKLNQEAAE
jgi:cytochrome bd ubiquinol oxidase subunit I